MSRNNALFLLQDAIGPKPHIRHDYGWELTLDPAKVARAIPRIQREAYAQGLKDGAARTKKIGAVPAPFRAAYLAGYDRAYKKPKMGRPSTGAA